MKKRQNHYDCNQVVLAMNKLPTYIQLLLQDFGEGLVRPRSDLNFDLGSFTNPFNLLNKSQKLFSLELKQSVIKIHTYIIESY